MYTYCLDEESESAVRIEQIERPEAKIKQNDVLLFSRSEVSPGFWGFLWSDVGENWKSSRGHTGPSYRVQNADFHQKIENINDKNSEKN